MYGIVITGNTNGGLITAQVELLKNTSTLVKEAPPGTVYKNVNIWVGSSGFATPRNIKEAVIKFKVGNSWITSGGFKDSEIVMLRWDGTQWVRLETRPGNKDDNFTYYEAKTYSFSPFAITGLKGGVVVPTENSVTGTTGTPAAAKTTTPVQKSEGNTNSLIVTAIILIVIIAILLVLYRQKRR